MLIELLGHQDFIKHIVNAVIDGGTSSTPRPTADYWRPYNDVSSTYLKKLQDPNLITAWENLEKLHEAFLKAAYSSLDAAEQNQPDLAKQHLNQMYGLSSQLLGLLIGSSISELMAIVGDHERTLAAQYEKDFLDAAQMGRFEIDLNANVLTEADKHFLSFIGYTRDEILSQSIDKLFSLKAFKDLVSAIKKQSDNTRHFIKAKDKTGQRVLLELIAHVDTQNHTERLHGFAVNITQTENEMQQRRLLTAAVEVSDQAVIITNNKHEIVYVNPAFTKITGYESGEVIGKNPRFLSGPETSEITKQAIREAVEAGKSIRTEVLNYAKDGRIYWVELSIAPVLDSRGEITHFISSENDITSRRELQHTTTRMALEDHLTGLANRRAAETHLELEWNRAQRDSASFALAIVDIDRFKLVNDQYGHHVGDQTLKHVSDLMDANLRGGDWMARWGGEEFLICFHDLDYRGALTAAERLRKLVKSRPVKLTMGELPITISIGVSLYSDEKESIDAMLAQADSLLYEAKHSGRDKVLCAGKVTTRKRGLIWEGAQVQSALNEGRLVPVFQPIVDLKTSSIVADEALARIRSKDESLIPAFHFIQAAEALHLVSSIDQSISTSAIERSARAINENNGASKRAHFINLSPQFLANGEHVESLIERARNSIPKKSKSESGFKPWVIEITERQTGDILQLKKHLQPLTDFGFQLALDDFGSGYSSFLYLAELPVNFLKIEGWMVQRLHRDKRTRQLVETIVNTAQKFSVTTVAECVEDSETAQVLCDIGVDWAQGYYFAEPALEENIRWS